MEENVLLEKAASHANPLIQADPLLASLAEKLLKEKQSQIASNPDASFIVATAGGILVEYYIEKLAAEKRLSKEDLKGFENFILLSGLTREECDFLIHRQLERWENMI